MSELKTAELGTVAEIVMGTSPPGSSYNHSAIGDPLLNGPTEFGPRHPDPVLFTTGGRRYAEPGDLLFCVRGSTTGRMNWADQRYAIGRGVAAIRGRSAAETCFLRAAIEAALPGVLAGATGATMPNLNVDAMRRIPIPVHTDHERVGAVFAALDDLIEINRRRVVVLEEMARAIYREWFVRFRYPGHEDVPLVDSPLGPIPDGWTVAPLGSVASVNRKTRKPNDDEVIRYLDISALDERTVGEVGEVSGAEAPGRARRVVRAGDVVWSMVRPNRRAHALLVEPGADWLASTGLAVLSPTGISSTWLFEMTSTQDFSDYLVSQEGGAAYPAVKARDFERAPVVVPAAETDRAFVERAAPLHRLGWLARSQTTSLAALRDLLLPKLVTGQIDVSHLDLDALTEAASA